MKTSKKWTALLLSALMMINCMCITAFAAGESPVSLGAPETVPSGTTARISVMTEADGIADGKLVFTYDPEMLSFVGAAASAAWSDKDAVVYSVNEREGRVVIAFAAAETAGEGELFALSFTALQMGEAGVTLDGAASYISGAAAVADETAAFTVGTCDVPDGYYRVIFNQGEHGIVSTSSFDIAVGSVIGTVPSVSPDFGYRVAGWMLDGQVYSAEEVVQMQFAEHHTVIFTAVYEFDAPAGQLPVAFYSGTNGGFVNGAQAMAYVTIGGSLTMAQVPELMAKNGYAFSGWYCYEDGRNYTTAQLLNMTFDAPARFMATFDPVMGPSDPVVDEDVVVNVDHDQSGSAVKVTVEIPAGKDGETITLPLEGEDMENVPVEIEISPAVDSVTVEIPMGNASAGLVIVIVNENGEEIYPKTLLTESGVAVVLSGNVTIKVIDNTKTFADADNHWAKNAITFVTARELFNGTGDNTFAPDATMTRAMLATVLWRMEGKGEADVESAFTDVADGQWYSEAIDWASEEGIINGYGDTFGVNDPITREQLATILWRLSGSPTVPTAVTGTSPWAADAMAWAVSVGLIQGDSNGLNASGTATRAQVATILMRYINL